MIIFTPHEMLLFEAYGDTVSVALRPVPVPYSPEILAFGAQYLLQRCQSSSLMNLQ